MHKSQRIAVIGAGLAGSVLANRLSKYAHVDVFEKSRGLGGRMSTRRSDPFQFDHGAQFFTARSKAFQNMLAPFIAAGVVAPWYPKAVEIDKGAITARATSELQYVAVPGMTALCKAMLEGTDVYRDTRVQSMTRGDQGLWSLESTAEQRFDGYHQVISTAPSVQTRDLMPQLSVPGLNWKSVRMKGCFSLMVGFDTGVSLPWDTAVIESGPLAWICNDSSKPGRPTGCSFLCQSDNDWAEGYLDGDLSDVQQILLDAFSEITDLPTRKAQYTSLHRWRYAKVATPADVPFALDRETGLAAAGDWFGGGRVEAAFESATALADALEPAVVEKTL